MSKHELVIKFLGDPDKIPFSDRILNLVLLVGFFVFVTASLINLLLGDTLMLIETGVSAAICSVGYYVSFVKGKTKIVAYIISVFIILVFMSNWIINQGSFGPIAFYIPHMTVVIYFLLYGRTRQSVLFLFVITITAALLYEYNNLETIAPYKDSAESHIDMARSNIQGIFFMIALLMYIQWSFKKDIVLKQKIMEELKLQRKDADTANMAKSMFLANINHEMRTSLNAIIGFSHLLHQHTDELHDEHKDYLQHIHQNGEHLMGLINNVLDLSTIEANKMVLIPEAFNLKENIQTVIAGAHAQAKEKGLEFNFSVSDDLPDVIISDKVKMNQILSNLLSNAIKFTSHGIVSIALKKREGALQIIVTDEGIGISADKQHSIFEEFEQADISTARANGGFGLGLAITRKITNLLKGEINVHSIPGKGTTFEVFLPLEEGTLKTETNNMLQHIPLSTKSKILLVEDNLINQEVMVAFLKQMGLQALLAENGEVALQMIDSERPDIVFMDLHMPVMDGFEAVGQLRKKYSKDELPVIALTADAFQQQLDKVIDSGFNNYITKPIYYDALEKLLAKHLQNRHSLD